VIGDLVRHRCDEPLVYLPMSREFSPLPST
jgi:hypothetical protein